LHSSADSPGPKSLNESPTQTTVPWATREHSDVPGLAFAGAAEK
jgi:hypothetical protein